MIGVVNVILGVMGVAYASSLPPWFNLALTEDITA